MEKSVSWKRHESTYNLQFTSSAFVVKSPNRFLRLTKQKAFITVVVINNHIFLLCVCVCTAQATFVYLAGNPRSVTPNPFSSKLYGFSINSFSLFVLACLLLLFVQLYKTQSNGKRRQGEEEGKKILFLVKSNAWKIVFSCSFNYVICFRLLPLPSIRCLCT